MRGGLLARYGVTKIGGFRERRRTAEMVNVTGSEAGSAMTSLSWEHRASPRLATVCS